MKNEKYFYVKKKIEFGIYQDDDLSIERK